MAGKELAQQSQNHILILCVDRDGDIEVKAGKKTPLLGRVANLDGAVALALKDPEEPDANAMFEAVRLYDQMLSKKSLNETFEVATISGTELGGVTADRKLAAELDNILETYSVTEIIFVSDGYTDETVFPIIESRGVPISSVRRITIKHSESIEETAAVFTKYLKMLVDTPRYSRLVLGIPGVLITLFALFWGLNMYNPNISMYYYGLAVASIVGFYLLIKGFSVDTSIKNGYKWIQNYTPPPLPIQISNYTTIAGIFCIIVSLYLGGSHASANLGAVTIEAVSQLPAITAWFIKGSMDLMVIGAIMILAGRSITFYFERDTKLLRNGALIAEVAWIRMIMNATANLLYPSGSIDVGAATYEFTPFVQSIVVGILIGIASILLVTIIGRSTTFFKKSEDEEEKPKESISEAL